MAVPDLQTTGAEVAQLKEEVEKLKQCGKHFNCLKPTYVILGDVLSP